MADYFKKSCAPATGWKLARGRKPDVWRGDPYTSTYELLEAKAQTHLNAAIGRGATATAGAEAATGRVGNTEQG